MKSHRGGKILLIGAVVYALLQHIDAGIGTKFWFLEWVLFALFVLGLWTQAHTKIKTWIFVQGKLAGYTLYMVFAWLAGMAYELTLTRTGTGLGGNHQDSLASFILSQGLYPPFVICTLLVIWWFRLTFDRALWFVAGYSLVEALVFRPFLLTAALSPFFFLTPIVFAYYTIVYAACSILPLLFMDESLFWCTKGSTKSINIISLLCLGFVVGMLVSIFWGLVWGPLMESVFQFPPVAEEVF